MQSGRNLAMSFSDRAIETRTWAEAEEGHQLDQRDELTPRVGAPTLTQRTQPGRRTILAFTGHRPQRMGGFNPWNAITYARNMQRPIFGINHTTRTAAWM